MKKIKKDDLVVGMQFLADESVATITELRAGEKTDEVQIMWLNMKVDLMEATRWHPYKSVLYCVNKYGWQVLSSLHKELL